VYYIKLPNSHDSQSASVYIGRIEPTTESVLRSLVVDPLPNFITMHASLRQKTRGRADRRLHIIRSWKAKSGWTRQTTPCTFWNLGSLLCLTACQWSITSTRQVTCTIYLTEQVGWRSGKCSRPAFGGSPAPIFTRTMVMMRYFSVFSFSLYRPRYDID